MNQVKKALAEESPFKPISFLQKEHLQQWLNTFPNYATGGIGLGDLSIIHDWKRQCQLNKGRRVYIWSLDDDLKGTLENRKYDSFHSGGDHKMGHYTGNSFLPMPSALNSSAYF